MSGIELASWGAIVFISLLVVVTGFMRKWREIEAPADIMEALGTENETRAHLNEGVRTYRILAEERGKTIKLLMKQLKELGEDYRQKCSEVKTLEGDIDCLRLRLVSQGPDFIPTEPDQLPLRLMKRGDIGKTSLGFKIKIDPFLSGDEMYLDGEELPTRDFTEERGVVIPAGIDSKIEGLKTTTKTGCGQEDKPEGPPNTDWPR